ncbi:hypothetical protein [Massilia sp. S19_KUP03_FR1]|uniref:hypothetical protein n=1 Tax=Massilia sp. S19_KUP03_FR1 TaxID=3025503 RepID=UPI002FCDB0DC
MTIFSDEKFTMAVVGAGAVRVAFLQKLVALIEPEQAACKSISLIKAAQMQLSRNGTRKSSLRAVFRLLRFERRTAGCSWRDLLLSDDTRVARRCHEAGAATSVRPWQRVLSATNDVIEQARQSLQDAAQMRSSFAMHRPAMATGAATASILGLIP